jgi:hypothetical protein
MIISATVRVDQGFSRRVGIRDGHAHGLADVRGRERKTGRLGRHAKARPTSASCCGGSKSETIIGR